MNFMNRPSDVIVMNAFLNGSTLASNRNTTYAFSCFTNTLLLASIEHLSHAALEILDLGHELVV